MNECIDALRGLLLRRLELDSAIDCASQELRADIEALEQMIAEKTKADRAELTLVDELIQEHREELQEAYDRLLEERFAHLKEGEIPPKGWALPKWIRTRTQRTVEVLDWSLVPPEAIETTRQLTKEAKKDSLLPGTKTVAKTSLVLYPSDIEVT